MQRAHVFIHQGSSWYLPYTLKTCLKSDPETPVILMGDKDVVPKVVFSPMKDYGQGAEVQEFNRRYLHLSTNAEHYELFCYQRWFYLLDHMKRHGLDAVLYHDTDVIFLSTMDEVRELYGEDLAYAAVCTFPPAEGTPLGPKQSMSGHSSYWTREALQDFCDFLLDAYTDEGMRSELTDVYRRYRELHPSGGICDMTLIAYFVERSARPIGNLLQIKRDCVFDHGVHVSDGAELGQFQMEDGRKIIRKREGGYYFIRQADGKPIRALAIHFQGGNKKLIHDYYRGNFHWKKFRKDLTGCFPTFSFLKNAEKKLRDARKHSS